MPKLYQGIKDALRKDDFVFFNQLVAEPFFASRMHFEDNYALKDVTKKGILSSVRDLLKIESVWLSFNEDELMHLADVFSNNPSVQQLIANTAFARLQHHVTNAPLSVMPFVIQMIEDSKILTASVANHNNRLLKLAIQRGSYSLVSALLKNDAVAKQCGLNELFLALKYSNHPAIVRALVKVNAERVGEEIEQIGPALTEGNFASLVGQLHCLKGISDKSALATGLNYSSHASALLNNSMFTPANTPRSVSLTPVPEEEFYSMDL